MFLNLPCLSHLPPEAQVVHLLQRRSLVKRFVVCLLVPLVGCSALPRQSAQTPAPAAHAHHHAATAPRPARPTRAERAIEPRRARPPRCSPQPSTGAGAPDLRARRARSRRGCGDARVRRQGEALQRQGGRDHCGNSSAGRRCGDGGRHHPGIGERGGGTTRRGPVQGRHQGQLLHRIGSGSVADRPAHLRSRDVLGRLSRHRGRLLRQQSRDRIRPAGRARRRIRAVSPCASREPTRFGSTRRGDPDLHRCRDADAARAGRLSDASTARRAPVACRSRVDAARRVRLDVGALRRRAGRWSSTRF